MPRAVATKCSLKKSKPCKGVQEVIDLDYGGGRGIFLLSLKNIKTMKTFQKIVFRKSNGEKYYLNFCPFCGAKIHE